MDENPDFVTLQHIPGYGRLWLVRHMRWDRLADSYQIHWESPPLTRSWAEITGQRRAQELRLEYRP